MAIRKPRGPAAQSAQENTAAASPRLTKPTEPRRSRTEKFHRAADFAALRLAGEDLLNIGERDGSASALLRAADRFREALSYGIDASVLQNSLGNALIRCAHLNNSVELAHEAHDAFQEALRGYDGSHDDAFPLRVRLNILDCSHQIAAISGDIRLIRFSISSLRDFTVKLRETISPDRARAEALLAEALLAHRDISRDPDGDLREALSAYENSINIDRDNNNSKNQTDRAINQTRYALALAEVGDLDKAIDYCVEAATNLKPLHPIAWVDARLSLADIYIMQGGHYLLSERDRARQLLKNARNIAEDVSSSRSTFPVNIIAKAVSRIAKVTGLLAFLEPDATKLIHLNKSVTLYNESIPYLSSGEQLSFSKERNIILSVINELIADSSAQLPDISRATGPMKSLRQDLNAFLREHGVTAPQVRAELVRDLSPRLEAAIETQAEGARAALTDQAQPLPQRARKPLARTHARLRAAYEQLKGVDLDDPALSEEERIGWASRIKGTYDTLKRRDLGFQFQQELVRKASAIVRRDQRHRAKPAL